MFIPVLAPRFLRQKRPQVEIRRDPLLPILSAISPRRFDALALVCVQRQAALRFLALDLASEGKRLEDQKGRYEAAWICLHGEQRHSNPENLSRSSSEIEALSRCIEIRTRDLSQR